MLRKAPKNSGLQQKKSRSNSNENQIVATFPGGESRKLQVGGQSAACLKIYQSKKMRLPAPWKKKCPVFLSLGWTAWDCYLSTSIYKSSLWMRNTLYVVSIFGKTFHHIKWHPFPPQPPGKDGPQARHSLLPWVANFQVAQDHLNQMEIHRKPAGSDDPYRNVPSNKKMKTWNLCIPCFFCSLKQKGHVVCKANV